MATFNEIYHSYLNGVQGIAPISGQQGITSLAKPIVPNTNDNANTNTNYSNNFNQDPNAKSMYSNYYMDNLGFGDILGGISGLASKAMGYPDVGYAIGALTGLGSGGPGMSYGASNYSGAVDTQDLGTLAANEATYGKGFASRQRAWEMECLIEQKVVEPVQTVMQWVEELILQREVILFLLKKLNYLIF
jgi:hypothetical protein